MMKNLAIVVVICFIGMGIGFSVWLGFFRDAHSWHRDLSQEKRGAEWVGQNPAVPPAKPINLIIQSSGCLRIDRARVDGDDLFIDLTRVCGASGDYAKLNWRAKAGNTVIESNYENWRVDGPDLGENVTVNVGDYREFQADPRITDIIISTRNH